jgi:hypothetical protein
MDKKVIYGLGAVVLIGGAIWYFNKRKQDSASMGDMGAMAEEPTEESGGGAGGGGGAPAPAPVDEAVGEMAKEEVKKSMDLGGLDMASTKVEKSAKVTAMVGSMVAQGKEVPASMVKAMLKAPIPKTTKAMILSATSQGKTEQSVPRMSAPLKGAVKTVSAPAKAVIDSIKGKGVIQTASAPAKAVVKTVSAPAKAVAKTISAPAKAVVKTVSAPAKAVAKTVSAPVKGAVNKISMSAGKAPAKASQLVSNVKAKFKKFDGDDAYDGFDGDSVMDNFSGASDF